MIFERDCNQCTYCHTSGRCPGCNDYWQDPHEDPTFLHPPEETAATLTEPEFRWVEFYGLAQDGRVLFVEVEDSCGHCADRAGGA